MTSRALAATISALATALLASCYQEPEMAFQRLEVGHISFELPIHYQVPDTHGEITVVTIVGFHSFTGDADMDEPRLTVLELRADQDWSEREWDGEVLYHGTRMLGATDVTTVRRRVPVETAGHRVTSVGMVEGYRFVTSHRNLTDVLISHGEKSYIIELSYNGDEPGDVTIVERVLESLAVTEALFRRHQVGSISFELPAHYRLPPEVPGIDYGGHHIFNGHINMDEPRVEVWEWHTDWEWHERDGEVVYHGTRMIGAAKVTTVRFRVPSVAGIAGDRFIVTHRNITDVFVSYGDALYVITLLYFDGEPGDVTIVERVLESLTVAEAPAAADDPDTPPSRISHRVTPVNQDFSRIDIWRVSLEFPSHWVSHNTIDEDSRITYWLYNPETVARGHQAEVQINASVGYTPDMSTVMEFVDMWLGTDTEIVNYGIKLEAEAIIGWVKVHPVRANGVTTTEIVTDMVIVHYDTLYKILTRHDSTDQDKTTIMEGIIDSLAIAERIN